MISEEQIQKRLHELRELGKVYAKAKATAVKIEEGKKSKLAVLMKQAELEGHKTAAAQEREARAMPEFMAMIETLGDAVEQAESARWQLEVAKIGVDLLRTAESSRRAEMKAFG